MLTTAQKKLALAASNLIDSPHKWVQHVSYADAEGNATNFDTAVRVCAVGALSLAHYEDYATNDQADYRAVFDELERLAQKRGYSGIIQLNDWPGERTFDVLKGVFREAIETS